MGEWGIGNLDIGWFGRSQKWAELGYLQICTVLNDDIYIAFYLNLIFSKMKRVKYIAYLVLDKYTENNVDILIFKSVISLRI